MRKMIGTLLAFSVAGCATSEKAALRKDIAALNVRIAASEASIDQKTGGLGAIVDPLHVRVGYRPIIAWGDKIAAAPPDQRTISFRQTSRSGYIERHKIGCPWPLSDGYWYAEIAAADSTKADVVIQAMSITPAANGLNISTPLSLYLESRVHGHAKACIGGGIGTNVFLDARKNLTATMLARFEPVVDGEAPYGIDLISPNNLSITVSVHLGWIGNLGIPFEVHNLAKTLSDGRIGLLYSQQGVMEVPGAGKYVYKMRSIDPQIVPDEGGVALSSGVKIEIAPASN